MLVKSVTIEKEDIGKNNRFRDNGDVSIGHFKPIVSDRYLSDLHEYVFHFTKTGNVKPAKQRIKEIEQGMKREFVET